MAKRMLIDTMHAEETRVVVLNGSRLEYFDFESANKKQLKGNVYLAKIIRVEPSLQAAFVDYGGNRHGFLSFTEIHPDYYQIPIADREALMAEEASLDEVEDESAPPEADTANQDSDAGNSDEDDGFLRADTDFEEVGGDDIEAIEVRRVPPRRNYRIQEVIKRRQILLVQVVKEERGTKGAALTTYLSFAGRYCVLMPNSPRGGGISRKISSSEDRKRLREIISDLPVAEGVGVILRTAGMERNKAEIKRDFTYLAKLWESIRRLTFESSAPALIHEEAGLISRAIRDLYSKDIEEVLIEGEAGYRTAKEFMRMLTRSHARRIKAYSGTIPLFHHYQIEGMLDAFHSPTVGLKSGGYIVIDPTEALVAIDVNSGRATRERNIEETAAKTNLEAAEEIAHQLRLRDLAGLIVIDFIDMENSRNLHNVERCMKEAVKGDRARIQLGRISHFGLMEMSRQRLRSSLLEASSRACPHCAGSGQIRSTESTALHVLRAIEEEGILARSDKITVHTPNVVALYILNQKRSTLIGIEKRYGFLITLESDDSLISPDYRLERDQTRASAEAAEESSENDEEKPGRKCRRRRPRSQRAENDVEDRPAINGEGNQEIPAVDAAVTEAAHDADDTDPSGATRDDDREADGVRMRRRRGRRGGRRRRESSDQPATETSSDEAVTVGENRQPPPDALPDTPEPETAPAKSRRKVFEGDDAKPKRGHRSRRGKAETEVLVFPGVAPTDRGEAENDGNGSSPTATSVPIAAGKIKVPTPIPTIETVVAETEAPKVPARKGWWNRLIS